MGKGLLVEQSVATEGTSFLPSSLLSFLPLSLSLLADFRRMEFKARLKLEDREDRSQWGSKWVCEREQISRGLKYQYSF